MTHQWNEIQVLPNVAPRPAVTALTQELTELAHWYYVASLGKFVDSRQPEVDHYEDRQFDRLYSYLPMPEVRTGRGRNTRNVPLKPSQYILQNCQTTNIVRKMVMEPSQPEGLIYENGYRVLNLHRKPPDPPELSREPDNGFHDHLLKVFNGNDEYRNHFEMWVAHLLFVPSERMTHGILISGGSGTGKSLIAMYVQKLLGPMFREINADEFTGDFSDWAVNTRLAFIEEIYEVGNFKLFNRIKPLFTSPTIRVNRKHENRFKINNHLHFLLNSNSPFPLHFEPDDRRIFYVHSRMEEQSHDYYDPLFESINGEGEMAWVWRKHLKNNVLPTIPEGFATHRPLQTEDHKAASKASLHPVEDYIQEMRLIAKGIYTPDKFFRKKHLMEQLHEKVPHVMKNRTAVEAALVNAGLVQEIFSHDGLQTTYCWFVEYDDVIRPLIGSNTKAGQQKRGKHFWT